mmetsp:Transcript_65212/g.176249  ORF Transcript_65212/g.176249 Transcript_65212/m.176249 type:complete len:235 (-) Transcript_65212:370-1074(-)
MLQQKKKKKKKKKRKKKARRWSDPHTPPPATALGAGGAARGQNLREAPRRRPPAWREAAACQSARRRHRGAGGGRRLPETPRPLFVAEDAVRHLLHDGLLVNLPKRLGVNSAAREQHGHFGVLQDARHRLLLHLLDHLLRGLGQILPGLGFLLADDLRRLDGRELVDRHLGPLHGARHALDRLLARPLAGDALVQDPALLVLVVHPQVREAAGILLILHRLDHSEDRALFDHVL